MENIEIIIEKELVEVFIDTNEKKLKYLKKGFVCDVNDTITVPYDKLLWTDEVVCTCPICRKNHRIKKEYIKRNKNTRCEQCKGKKNTEAFCQFCGERNNRTYNGKGICNRHRFQIMRYGKVIQGRHDLNTYIKKDTYYEIELWSKDKKLNQVGYVDIEDYDKIKNIRWHLEKSGSGLAYLSNCKNGKTTRMHNLILDKDCIVDHINGNGLDNRRENLRYVTNSQNIMNTKTRKNTKSGIKGVSYAKEASKKWLAHICINNVNIREYFNDLEDASIYRKNLENEYFAEYKRNHEWKDEYIYINGIKEFSDSDGEDFRTVIYISGCWWNCDMCHNPQTHDLRSGEKIKISDLIKAVNKIKCDNITISGGDGFTYQIRETYELIKELKLYNNKNIWVYTGYKIDDLIKDKNPIRQEVLKYIDVLVDGKFDYKNSLEHKNPLFRGDDSQRLIDVQKTLKNKEIVLYSN